MMYFDYSLNPNINGFLLFLKLAPVPHFVPHFVFRFREILFFAADNAFAKTETHEESVSSLSLKRVFFRGSVSTLTRHQESGSGTE